MSIYRNVYGKKHNKGYVPYTYLIKHIPSGMVYYGAKFSKDAHPDFFFKYYFTSSKIIKSILESEGIDVFVFEIRKTFTTREECVNWESKVHRRMNVSTHEKFFNIDQNQQHHDNGGTTFISNPVTEECIRVKIDSYIPNGWIYGNINRSSDKNISNRRWFHDPNTMKCAFDIIENIPKDWLPGRGPAYKSNSEKLKSKGRFWITNGIESRLVESGTSLPIGWSRGRTVSNERQYDAKSSGYGCIIITNGIENKRFYGDQIPNGWTKGSSALRGRTSSTKGKICYLDTSTNKKRYLNKEDEVPEYFIRLSK